MVSNVHTHTHINIYGSCHGNSFTYHYQHFSFHPQILHHKKKKKKKSQLSQVQHG